MTARSFWCAAILALFVSTHAFAGPLFNHPNAGGPAPLYTGSTPFLQGTLSGYVDYAVFNPGQFPYSGYTPTAGEYTYAYQVFVTGAAPLSSFAVLVPGPADNIGSFSDISGQAPLSGVFTGPPGPGNSAKWTFGGVLTGNMTQGLAYSSPNPPVSSLGSTVDTGQSAWVIPLPAPDPTNLPEPASALLAMGCMLLGLRRRGNK